MGNAPATPPALEEVEAAEARASELARAYFAAALRAKTLRMARAVAGADEWVPLRATRGDKRRFMKSDRAAAMAKYVWFRRVVRERRWRGYRLYDYDLGCHGWMISDETRADVSLPVLKPNRAAAADVRHPGSCGGSRTGPLRSRPSSARATTRWATRRSSFATWMSS